MNRFVPGGFSLAVSLTSLLLTLVICQALWHSYYPPYDREALKARRDHYEKILLKADLSWKEGLYYKEIGGTGRKR